MIGNYPSGNGTRILITQETVDHMKAHPIELNLLKQAFLGLEIDNGKWFVGTTDLGRIVGKSMCLETEPIDIDQQVLFGFRHNRKTATRCIRGEGIDTSCITVVLRKGRYQDYFMVSAWAGSKAMPEPTHITQKDRIEYWSTHALVYEENNFDGEPFFSTWREVLRK
jgi:hypothetical protein